MNHERQNLLDRIAYSDKCDYNAQFEASEIVPKSITGKQSLLMENMLYSNKTSEEDKNYLRLCLKLNHLSIEQKHNLNKIYKKSVK